MLIKTKGDLIMGYHYEIRYKDFTDNHYFYKIYKHHLTAKIAYFFISRMFDIVDLYERKD